MGFVERLRSWWRGPGPAPGADATFERLPWLEPHESPFGVRVLDCRPVAETFLSAAEGAGSIQFFGSPEARSDEPFRGQHPEDAIRVSCDLTYPLRDPLPEGPVFLAAVLEEKWNIYHFDRALYLVRSWTGHLQYVAGLADAASELRVTEVEAWPGSVLGAEQM